MNGRTMNTSRLYEILAEVSGQFRKGAEITEHESSGLRVVEVYAMPHESETQDLERVDCHFVIVGVNKEAAEARRHELLGLLQEYEPRSHWTGGPSYIHVGGVIGDQGAALQLFGVGHVLGWWKVLLPKDLGIGGSDADKYAGHGMIYAVPAGEFVQQLNGDGKQAPTEIS